MSDADLESIAGELTDVDAALVRLDDGTYGSCEVCGVPLADDVLRAAPAGRRCPAHGAPTI